MPEKPQKSGSPNSLRITAREEPESETNLQRRDCVVIGRGTDCDVVIKDAKASRRHCKLTRQESGFLLEDLASRNGTYVDGVKIAAPVLLKTKQTFKIGDTVFYLA